MLRGAAATPDAASRDLAACAKALDRALAAGAEPLVARASHAAPDPRLRGPEAPARAEAAFALRPLVQRLGEPPDDEVLR